MLFIIYIYIYIYVCVCMWKINTLFLNILVNETDKIWSKNKQKIDRKKDGQIDEYNRQTKRILSVFEHCIMKLHKATMISLPKRVYNNKINVYSSNLVLSLPLEVYSFAPGLRTFQSTHEIWTSTMLLPSVNLPIHQIIKKRNIHFYVHGSLNGPNDVYM